MQNKNLSLLIETSYQDTGTLELYYKKTQKHLLKCTVLVSLDMHKLHSTEDNAFKF